MWTVSNGIAGFQVQCEGVAQALGVAPERRIITRNSAVAEEAASDPVPDLVIASGRPAAATALALRARGAFVVMLQNPRMALARFDLVWAPEHDRLRGANVIATPLSPHPLTAATMAHAGEALAARLKHLPSPYLAALIGGPSTSCPFTLAEASATGARLRALCATHQASALVIASRRTPQATLHALADAMGDTPRWLWHPSTGDDNPYLGALGLADALAVSADSVNMLGEALATDKAVFLLPLRRRFGRGRRLKRFLDGLAARGWLRDLADGKDWSRRTPIDCNRAIATAIIEAWRGGLQA